MCARAKRLGCDGIEVGALRNGSPLEVVQRLGIHGDVEAHLGLGCGAVCPDVQRLGFSTTVRIRPPWVRPIISTKPKTRGRGLPITTRSRH